MRRMMLAQGLGGITDFTFTGQEHQHVAGADARQFIDRFDHRVHQIALAALALRLAWDRLDFALVGAVHRAVAQLDLVQAAGDLDHRRRPVGSTEMAREAIGVDGGRGDDDLQIGTLRQQLLQVAEQEVDIEAALVRFVDDDRVVLPEQRIGLRLGQQYAVGHQLDPRALAQGVREAHLEADVFAQR